MGMMDDPWEQYGEVNLINTIKRLESQPRLNVENLDSLIRVWRARRDKAETDSDRHTAACYVDAFQTVRVNHGLPLLKKRT